MKKLVPVRLLKNKFADIVFQAEQAGASTEILKEILGRARAKRGMFEGDVEEGELEIGQVSAAIKKVSSVQEVVVEILADFEKMTSLYKVK